MTETFREEKVKKNLKKIGVALQKCSNAFIGCCENVSPPHLVLKKIKVSPTLPFSNKF